MDVYNMYQIMYFYQSLKITTLKNFEICIRLSYKIWPNNVANYV